MPTPVNDRLRVLAVIQALKTAGVRVKNWKNLLNGASQNTDDTVRKGSQSKFAFGRDLHMLPQCHDTDVGGTVPMFLVDACKYLSQHLHTEGLFRKTGSFSRIRQLRADLERGEPVFSLPHLATLQPSDVASVLKQFLRELPSPLIPVDLQGPLCRAQCLEEEGQEGGKDGATLLLTALFPPSHSRTLRYFCTFLRLTAQRCDENRMEVGNLALVISPNLLQYPAGVSKFTVGTERQLDRQAAVIKTLITNADRIGVIPSSILSMSTVEESGEATPPPGDGEGFQAGVRLGVYRSLRRQRRRSVGEIFVDALRQLKPGRTPPTVPSNPTDSQQNAKSSTPQSPIIAKRKSTDDLIQDVEGSAKKRRSIHDLREDKHPVRKQHSDTESSIGPECSHLSVLSAMEGSRAQEPCVTLSASEKKRNQKRDQKRLNRPMARDDKAQRRRTLRFFSWTSPTTSSSSIGTDTENWLIVDKMLPDGMTEASGSEVVGPPSVPVIVIDGPERVVVGNEVEDDPDLLNYSFAENPSDFLDLDTTGLPVELEREGGGCECPDGKLGNEMDETKTTHYDANSELWAQEQAAVKEDAEEMGREGLGRKVRDMFGQVSQKPCRPRRSISMPDVTLEKIISQDKKAKKEKEKGGMTGQEDEIGVDTWSPSSNVVEEAGTMTSGDKGLGKEMNEGEELVQERLLDKKEETMESGPAFKRTHARMSVTDRLRRFNALAMMLRTPRAPPATPKPQLRDVLHESQLVGGHRGAVRLRRQGARRFGRSMSHDAVAETSSEQNSARKQALVEIPSFGELEDRSPSKLIKPQPTLNTSHRDERLETQQTQNPELQDGVSQTPHYPGTPSSNREQSQESCDGKPNKSPPQSQEQPKESDLHDLLEMQLNICDPKQDPGKEEDLPGLIQLDRPSQTTVDVMPRTIPQTMVPQQHQPHISEVKLPFSSPPTPSLSHADTCTLNDIIPALAQKDSTSPTENDNTAYMDANCSGFNLIEIDVGLSAVGGCPLSVVLSSPGLQFRPPGTRRRYRDSPRRSNHDISLATGDSLLV